MNLITLYVIIFLNLTSLYYIFTNVVYLRICKHLIVYLKTLNHTFQVIAVSETWANDVIYSLLNISGYNSLTKYHIDRRGDDMAVVWWWCVFFDNIKITRVINFKFLGVLINSRLTWNDDIKTISSKLSKNIGILAEICHNIPSTTLIQLCHTLVQPYLEYCNKIWAASSNSSVTMIFIKQKNHFTIRV